MFAYPKQAEFNRIIPKTKIYAYAKVSKRIKNLFAAQVAEIRWRYKLSPETINLPARDRVTEIQVFEIVLRTPGLDEGVLQAIDRAIPFPLVFELTYGNQVRFAAAHKRPSEAESSKWVIETNFETEPRPIDAERQPLPIALDLASLYQQMVRQHISLPQRNGESLVDHIARYESIAAKKRERKKLEARLDREKQFNRKVELNAQVRALRAELSSLQRL
jgi:Domain of unknown function (DUF4391)